MISFTSCKEILFEENISQKEVILYAPTDFSETPNTDVTFWWEVVDGATGYHSQVGKPTFISPIVLELDTVVADNMFTKSLLPANYQWRVRAVNFSTETIYTIGSFSVTVDDGFSGKKVVLLQPVENKNTNINELEFKWDAVEGAIEYRFEVWKPNTTGEQVHFQLTDQTQSVLSLGEGKFTWRVRAQNDLANTLYTSNTLIIDLTPPNTPVLTSPEDNTIIEEEMLDFEWTRNEVIGSSETDSIYIYSDMENANLVLKDIASDKKYSLEAETSTYYWAVKAFDKAGNESSISEIFKVDYTKTE